MAGQPPQAPSPAERAAPGRSFFVDDPCEELLLRIIRALPPDERKGLRGSCKCVAARPRLAAAVA